jgi:hypothetical protein
MGERAMGTRRDGDEFARAKATEPEGISSKNRVTGDDDDVEGHGFRHASTTEPEGISSKNRVTGDDDDVEGHGFHLRSPSSRGE